MAHLVFLNDSRRPPGDVTRGRSNDLDGQHDVSVVATATALWAMLAQRSTDVVVLDTDNASESQLDIIVRMQALYPGIGLVVLAAASSAAWRIECLQGGADYVLARTVENGEFDASIAALCRRVSGNDQVKQPLAQDWLLRCSERQLQINGLQTIDLTEKEFNFLHLLAVSTRPVAREALNHEMHVRTGSSEYNDAKRFDMLVYRLRRKVKAGLCKELPLHSAYGAGYSLSVAFQLS